MNSGRTIFVSGVVLGAALGFSAGHLSLWGRYQPVQPNVPEVTLSQVWPNDLQEPEFLPLNLGEPLQPLSTALATSIGPQDATTVPEVTSGRSQLPASPTNVLDQSGALPVELGVAAADPITPELQQLLPPTTDLRPRTPPPAIQAPDAQPLNEANAEREQSIRILVDREFQNAPAHQRDVWYESLRDLSKEDAQNVLRMWKQFGGPIDKHANSPDPLNIFRSPLPLTNPSAPVASPGRALEDHALLRHALQMRQRNVLHLETPGFKRVIPLLIERPVQAENQMLSHIEPRVDFAQGMHQPTDSPLDWAIDGSGFFAVTNGQETLYTRNGHWTLDANRRLILAGSRPPLHLVGDWKLPEGAIEITVSLQGVVSVTVDAIVEADAAVQQDLGQVELATFLNSAALETRPNGLFAVTAASGTAQLAKAGATGRGELLQGVLELSNVEAEVEYLAIEDLNSLLKE